MAIFRTTTLHDADSLIELAIKCFVNAYAKYNTPSDMEKYISENFSLQKISAEISDPGILSLLATRENQLVGYAKLLFKTELQVGTKKPLEIARLYTRVDLIGAGIGKMMIKEICDYAAENNFDAVCLGVWKNNPRAIRFYEREGFTIAGTTPFLFGTDLQEDFIMLRKIS